MINSIPLRLIINTHCNGKCYFCHKEGANSSREMPLDLILECANTARFLSAPVTLTGGEPTLRKDLDIIISEINRTVSDINLGLTTNGANLIAFSNIKTPIDTLNLSIASFDNDISQKYQRVNPQEALNAFAVFPAKTKNINVVVTKDNYLQVKQFIDYCIKNNYNLDLMFELKEYTEEDLIIQKSVFNCIEAYDNLKIILKPSPVLEFYVCDSVRIRIKHPYLSSMPRFNFCKGCSQINQCYERICSIRVHPDGQISPCLSRDKSRYNFSKKSIIQLYNEINNVSLLSFITSNYN